MNFLIDHKCVFDAAGNMLQNVLFAATDIRENLTKKENLRAFGTCGEMYPVLYGEPQQMQQFITLLCDTANKGHIGQMHYNLRTCKNFVLCTHDQYKATLSERTEKQKVLYAPLYMYEPLEAHREFTDLCRYLIKAIRKNDAKVIILDNCAHYLQCMDYRTIQTDLEMIAHDLDCCIFAGFCIQDIESTCFDVYQHNIIDLKSDQIHGQHVIKYFYNNGACMGIFSIDSEGKINASKWHEQYLLRELLPCVASEPVFSKDIELFLLGVFTGDKEKGTITKMLQGARKRGELIRANTRSTKYIVNNGECKEKKPYCEPKQQQGATEIALTAFSDMQKNGIRKRIPIINFGEYRQLYSCYYDCPPCAMEIIICAIMQGEYLNIKANRQRKKILFCTQDDVEYLNIESYLQKSINNITDFEKCHIIDIKNNLASIEEYIKEYTPDYVIISTGNFEGKRVQNEIPAFELQRLAQTYNIAIIVNYDYLDDRENLQWLLDRNNDLEEYWTQIAPTGNASIIRGACNGIAFKHIAMYKDPDSGKLWTPQKDEFKRAVLEEIFSAYTGRIIANGIVDIITGKPLATKDIKTAAKMGIIKLFKKPIKVNKHRHIQYVVQYIHPKDRAK